MGVRIELLKNEGDFGDIDFLDGFMQFKFCIELPSLSKIRCRHLRNCRRQRCFYGMPSGFECLLVHLRRRCGTDLGESNCVTESEGDFSATACSCLTDNCNMED